jgi:hypothetical protein
MQTLLLKVKFHPPRPRAVSLFLNFSISEFGVSSSRLLANLL